MFVTVFLYVGLMAACALVTVMGYMIVRDLATSTKSAIFVQAAFENGRPIAVENGLRPGHVTWENTFLWFPAWVRGRITWMRPVEVAKVTFSNPEAKHRNRMPVVVTLVRPPGEDVEPTFEHVRDLAQK